MYSEFSLYGPWWLLIPLVIVLAPVGVLVAVVVVLTLYSMLSGHVSGQITVGHVEPSPWWVYLLEGAAALLIVAVIVYLIRRRQVRSDG